MSGEMKWPVGVVRGDLVAWDGNAPQRITGGIAPGYGAGPFLAPSVLQFGADGLPEWTLLPYFASLGIKNWLWVGAPYPTVNNPPWNTDPGDLTAGQLIIPNHRDFSSVGSMQLGLVDVYADATNQFPMIIRGENVPTALRLFAAGAAAGLAGSVPMVRGYSTGGTTASPTQTLANKELLRLSAGGFQFTPSGGTFFDDAGYLSFFARQNWTPTTTASFVAMALTPLGSTTQTGCYWFFPEGLSTAGWIYAGGNSNAPFDTAAGTIASTARIYPGNQGSWYLDFVSGQPIIAMDSSDFLTYDRVNNYFQLYIGSSVSFQMGPTAIEYRSYGARVTNTAVNKVVAPATVVAMTWDSEDYDIGNCHSTTVNTSRLSAPVNGRFHITGGVYWNAEPLSTTSLLLLRISKNGTPIPGARTFEAPIASIGVNGHAQNISIDVAMNFGDYVELEVFFDAGAANRNINLSNGSFSMHYIGGL